MGSIIEYNNSILLVIFTDKNIIIKDLSLGNIKSEMMNQRNSQTILKNMNKVFSLLKTNKYNLTQVSDELQFTPAFYEVNQ